MWLSGWKGRSSVAAIATSALFLSLSGSVLAKDSAPAALPEVALSALPAQAQDTHRLVLSGGPFPYQKDGVVFGNRERLLPRHPRGYYREYTVKTPGSRDRGARRIICGGSVPTVPDACFYTADHYASFKRIRAEPAR